MATYCFARKFVGSVVTCTQHNKEIFFIFPVYDSHFVIRKQKQIFIIEKRFNVFQNIPHWDRYNFTCVWTNCRSTFATLIEVSPKHALWTLLQVLKNVDLSFYFLSMGIKRSHSMPSQDYTADNSSNRCFECSKTQLCESRHWLVKSDQSSAVDFPDFWEDNWQTNGCVPLRIDICIYVVGFIWKTGFLL